MSSPTNQRILDAAQHLMQAQGYTGLSFAGVATAVGLRKASIFHHFPTKEDLARYASLYQALLQRREHMCLCGLLAAEALTLPETVRVEMRAYFVEHEAWLSGVLAAGQAAGLPRIEGPLTTVAAFVLAGIEGAMLVARAHDDDARFEAIAAQLLASLTSPR